MSLDAKESLSILVLSTGYSSFDVKKSFNSIHPGLTAKKMSLAKPWDGACGRTPTSHCTSSTPFLLDPLWLTLGIFW